MTFVLERKPIFMQTLAFFVGLVVLLRDVHAHSDIVWKDAKELSLGGLALLNQDRESPYDRLPASAKAEIPPDVWTKSIDSAGVHVEFETDATEIWIKYTLMSSTLELNNMDSMGASGVDIFAFDSTNKMYRWLAAWASVKYPTSEGMLVNFLQFPEEKTMYRINFPLYNRVASFEVGVPRGTKYFSASSRQKPAPIVWYGSSIAQGASAQVPSSAYMHQLNLANYPGGQIDILNFGFSSNGKMDLSVMSYLNQITPVKAFVIDCLPNMSTDEVANKTIPLVHSIRESHESLMPVILVESATYANEWFNVSARTSQQKKRDTLRACYDTLIKEGVKELYYVYGNDLIPQTPIATVTYQVDGTHPTDLGMHKMFEFWNKQLPAILNGQAMSSPSEHSSYSIHPTQPVPASPEDIVWKDAHELSLGGLALVDQARESPYDRLPLSAKGVVPDGVWTQAVESAGVHVEFETDATEIWISYTLLNSVTEFSNMAAIGNSGVDIFAFDPENKAYRWLNSWVNVSFPLNEGRFVNWLQFPADKTLYRINFPLYNRVSTLRIGVPRSSKVFAPSQASKPAPIVWYGTSIAQGKSAQTASSAYMHQLNLANYPGGQIDILNFGFSSNGKMDLSVMSYLNQITPVKAFVIDCLPNMSTDEVANKTIPLVHSIRESHESLMPVILVESATYANEWFNVSARTSQQKKRDTLRACYDTLIKEGVKELYYVYGNDLIPQTPIATVTYQVDGTHPTDLGMHKMFEFWNKQLPAIVSNPV